VTRPYRPNPHTDEDAPRAERPPDEIDQPVSRLRGASAAVDPRRAARVAVGLVLATLLVLTVVFALVGQHKNQQIDELRNHGVPVTYTVTTCRELLGGSGSNGAGFDCTGTYTLDGHRYVEALPGTAEHAPGATVSAVAVPSDPTLLSTAAIVRSEHASGSVYVLPAVFFVLFMLVLAMVALSRRRRRKGQAGGV
jgi:Na+-transporting methylmalonyl-CoA/oxaloacetate decarboxylase gamma subunit